MLKVEKEALLSGTAIDLGNKGSSYYVYDVGRTVGYNSGKPSQYMRIEVTNSLKSAFHGHSISSSDYNGYLKNKI